MKKLLPILHKELSTNWRSASNSVFDSPLWQLGLLFVTLKQSQLPHTLHSLKHQMQRKPEHTSPLSSYRAKPEAMHAFQFLLVLRRSALHCSCSCDAPPMPWDFCKVTLVRFLETCKFVLCCIWQTRCRVQGDHPDLGNFLIWVLKLLSTWQRILEASMKWGHPQLC